MSYCVQDDERGEQEGYKIMKEGGPAMTYCRLLAVYFNISNNLIIKNK